MAKKKQSWLEQVIEAQQYPPFIEWMAAMEERLAWFRTTVIPDFTGDPHTIEAVDFAERRLLEIFPSYEQMRSVPDSEAVIDGFTRFIGEAFVHGLGGQWLKMPRDEPDEVRDRWYSAIVSVGDNEGEVRNFAMVPTINSVVDRRSGHKLAWLWNLAIKDMEENGRDPRTNTTDLIARLRRESESPVDLEEITPKHPVVEAYAFLPVGRRVTQAEVRAVFDVTFAKTNKVVTEVPHRIDATNPTTGHILGVTLNTAEVSPGSADYIQMTLEEHPHPRAAEFTGATDLLYVFVTGPDDELIEDAIVLTENFTEDFKALVYLLNAGVYDG